MPSLRKPKMWNLKPQLTAAPELWEGMTSAGAVWEGDGAPFDIQARKYPVLATSFDVPFFILTPRGWAMNFNQNSRRGQCLRMDHLAGVLDGISAFTYSVYARFDGTADGDEDNLGLQWSALQGSNDNNATRVLFGYRSSSSELFLALSTTSGFPAPSRNVSIDDGQFHLLTIWWDGSVVRIIVDGEVIGADFSAPGPLISLSTSKVPEVFGGHLVTRGSSERDSPRFTLAAWTLHVGKALDLDLIKAQACDPFAMFRPAGF